MAWSSNVQTDLAGYPLPFFFESLMANALGVNVFAQSPDLYGPDVFMNPYVFPPICLIPQVLKYLNCLKLSYTLVIPDVVPRHFWWPLLLSRALPVVCWPPMGQLVFFSLPRRMVFHIASQFLGTFGFSVFPINRFIVTSSSLRIYWTEWIIHLRYFECFVILYFSLNSKNFVPAVY